MSSWVTSCRNRFSRNASRATEAWEVAQRYDEQGHLTNWLGRNVTGKPAAEKIKEGNIPSFPFPGGIPLGILMTLNLLAAHGLKFKVQARGPRVWWGIGTVALGAALTWWIIFKQQGEITSGISSDAQGYLWNGIAIGFAALWALSGYGLLTYGPEKKQQRIYTAIGGLLSLAAFLFVMYRLYYLDSPLLDPNNTRILWQLIQAEFAALTLLAGCYLLFIKRAGVTLLHGGILLLFFNELLVYNSHVEWQMQIAETRSAWYAHDVRDFEIAIERDGVMEPVKNSLDSNPKAGEHFREVISVPLARLWDREEKKSKGRLSDPELPFDLEAIQCYPNSTIRDLRPGEKLLATQRAGARRLWWMKNGPPVPTTKRINQRSGSRSIRRLPASSRSASTCCKQRWGRTTIAMSSTSRHEGRRGLQRLSALPARLQAVLHRSQGSPQGRLSGQQHPAELFVGHRPARRARWRRA